MLGRPYRSAPDVRDLLVAQTRLQTLQAHGAEALEALDRTKLCLTDAERERLDALMPRVTVDMTVRDVMDLAHATRSRSLRFRRFVYEWAYTLTTPSAWRT